MLITQNQCAYHKSKRYTIEYNRGRLVRPSCLERTASLICAKMRRQDNSFDKVGNRLQFLKPMLSLQGRVFIQLPKGTTETPSGNHAPVAANTEPLGVATQDRRWLIRFRFLRHNQESKE
jgi:hypothetical protein